MRHCNLRLQIPPCTLPLCASFLGRQNTPMQVELRQPSSGHMIIFIILYLIELCIRIMHVSGISFLLLLLFTVMRKRLLMYKPYKGDWKISLIRIGCWPSVCNQDGIAQLAISRLFITRTPQGCLPSRMRSRQSSSKYSGSMDMRTSFSRS